MICPKSSEQNKFDYWDSLIGGIIIFVALDNKGNKVSAQDIKDNKAFCPACGERLITKRGMSKTWHFAHSTSSRCSIYTGESNEHKMAKEVISSWINMYNLECFIEKSINTDLRADILTIINNRSYAFEYQRSYLSKKEISKRTSLYQRGNITPIWIFGQGDSTPRIMPSYILNYISNINNTKHSFFQLNKSMLGFKKIFPISKVSPNKIYCEEVFLPFNNNSPSQLLNYNQVNINKNELVKHYNYHKKQWRLTPKNIKNRHTKAILDEMYLQRISPLLIPIEVGLPVPFSYLINDCSVEWQLKIFLFVLNRLKIGQSINVREIKQSISRFGIVTPNVLPNVKNLDYFLPIYYYLDFLCNVDVLQKDNNGNFIKVKDFKKPNHIEEAMKADSIFIDLFAKLTISKIIGE
ncbi:MAG: putative competence protein/transcription factor [Bacillales bacterium]|jgi:competence CoiA-like predicted nuclease|nr:putative competence protein/transcription factor [Bacillales bacterium]